MSVDIRQYTRVIIRKNNEYLQGKSCVFNKLVWCKSPWDAWWTRNADCAREVAKKTGGIALLFNPVARMISIL